MTTAPLYGDDAGKAGAVNHGTDDGLPLVGATAMNVTAPDGFAIGPISLTRHQALAAGTAGIFSFGLILGFAVPPPSKDPEPWARISSIIGWWYFMAWAVSFLPQLYLNWRRKSVVGQSFDYVFMNVLGFLCYSIYNVSFFAVSAVKEDYKERFGHSNNVQANDVAFAVYSLCCVLLNTWQILNYDQGPQRVNKLVVVGIFATVVVLAIWGVLLVFVHKEDFFNTLDWLYGLSVVKLAVTIIKYLPQIYLNYKRKLTTGWNIWNVLLDFTGGTLSVAQELIDAASTDDYSSITGNMAKFLLGSMSMIYDVVFMIQHFCLYKDNNDALKQAELQRQRDEGAAAQSV